jgi:hypothetical protein
MPPGKHGIGAGNTEKDGGKQKFDYSVRSPSGGALRRASEERRTERDRGPHGVRRCAGFTIRPECQNRITTPLQLSYRGMEAYLV